MALFDNSTRAVAEMEGYSVEGVLNFCCDCFALISHLVEQAYCCCNWLASCVTVRLFLGPRWHMIVGIRGCQLS